MFLKGCNYTLLTIFLNFVKTLFKNFRKFVSPPTATFILCNLVLASWCFHC